jgi:CheY-like chemotaxis protein
LRFGPAIRNFLDNLGEGTLKGFGLEATGKRKVEAVAAIAAAQAESGAKRVSSSSSATSPDLIRISDAVINSSQLITSSAIRSSINKTILWVDDEPENNLYERKAFRALGFRVWNARSTEDALRFIQDDNQVDVVISDMSRPEGPQAGYELLEKIQRLGVDVPFIIYSSTNTYEQKAMAKQKGAFGSTTDAGRLTELVLNAVKYAASFG